MISVVITCHNYGRFVERAIRSCINQRLPKDQREIIVVNDASTDHTMDVLENYRSEVQIVDLKENVGLAAARNIGIRKAKGQYVVFLDADDYLHQEMLGVQRLFLEENNYIDAVSVDYYTVNEVGKHIEHINSDEKPIACGIMFRKDYLYDIGLYDEEFLAREEEDLRHRFLKKYKIYNLILPLYRYRQHDSNLTNDKEKMDEFAAKLEDKHGKQGA